MEPSEQLFYEIRQYCLLNIPIRSLWLSRIRRLDPDFQPEIDQGQSHFSTPEILWNSYEEKMAEIRLRIARSETPNELTAAMMRGISLQEAYELEMLRLFEHWPDTDKDVKASDWISTGVIRFEYQNWLRTGGELLNATTYTPTLLLELKRVRKLKRLKEST